VCILLFPVSDILLSVLPLGEAAGWISNAFGIVGFGALGLATLRLTDAEWESPSLPERVAVGT
jgi:hypothetical protein